MTTLEYQNCVDLFADRLYRFALKEAAQQADAQDAVQTAYERLWLRHHEVEAAGAKAYLFQTVYHCIIDLYRKQSRVSYQEQSPETAMPRELASRYEVHDALQLALQTLPPEQRAVVMLRDYEGYTYEEIANITELSLAQVKVYIFRARQKLQQSLRHVYEV